MRFKKESTAASDLIKVSSLLMLFGVLVAYSYSHYWSLLGHIGWWALPLGVVLAPVFYVLVVLISHQILGLRSYYNLVSELHDMMRDFHWWQIIVLSIAAGIGEELLFRGFAQTWLASSIGIFAAIMLSSFIFAVFHALNMYYFWFAFAFSVLLGVLFHISQSVLLVIVLHTVYDVIALACIAKYPHIAGVRAFNSEGRAGPTDNI